MPQLRLGQADEFAVPQAQDHAAADLHEPGPRPAEDDGGEGGSGSGSQTVRAMSREHPAVDGDQRLGQRLRPPQRRPRIVEAVDEPVHRDEGRATGPRLGRVFLGLRDGAQHAAGVAGQQFAISRTDGEDSLRTGGRRHGTGQLPARGGQG